MDLSTPHRPPLTRSLCHHVHEFVTSWVTMFWLGNQDTFTPALPRLLACTLEAVQSLSKEVCALIKLFLCLVPLALARVIPNVVNQTVFRALSMRGDEVKQLAGFGIALNMYQLFECSLTAFSNVSQVLIKTKRDRHVVGVMGLITACCMMAVCVVMSATSLGNYCFAFLFNVDDTVVLLAQHTLGYISVNLLLQAVSELHAGIVIQAKDTSAILLSSVLNLGVQMVICLGLVGVTRGTFHPLVVPICAIYAGNLVKFLVIISWYYLRIHGKLAEEDIEASGGYRATRMDTLRVFLPLASLAFARAITVPFARIFMGKGLTEHQAGVENAVFSLILPVERLFTSWLNRLKDVYLAFRKDKTILTTERTLIFTVFCLITSVTSLAIFCGVVDISDSYFFYVFKVSWRLSRKCSVAMTIFIYLPFFACLRAHAVYWLVKSKFTSVIMPCVCLRLLAIPVTDLMLMWFGIGGAKLASGLCVACHGVEAVLLTAVAAYYKTRTKKDPEKVPLMTPSDSESESE